MDYEGRIALALLSALTVGALIFVTTLVCIFRKRSVPRVRRSARNGWLAAVVVGLAGLFHWAFFTDQSLLPFAPISIPIFYIAPTFLTVFYLGLMRTRSSPRKIE